MQNPATEADKAIWHFDSGFGKHITGDQANLINYKPCNNGPTIIFVGGELNPTLGLGDVKIGCLTIKGVLHVQDLKFNLFVENKSNDH